jgi:hypothetical protein
MGARLPQPLAQSPTLPFDCYRCGVRWSDVERAQGPAACCVRIRLIAQERRRLVRRYYHLELVEGHPQSIATSLQVRLLARPARKESLLSKPLRKRAERKCFPRREEMLGNLVPIELGADMLHIDTELAPSTHCDECEITGMRHVKV